MTSTTYLAAWGGLLIAIAGVINAITGFIAVLQGRKTRAALAAVDAKADDRHAVLLDTIKKS